MQPESESLKETLLQEFKRQQTEDPLEVFDREEEPLGETKVQRLEELARKEQVERYHDIVNVHAAAMAHAQLDYDR